MNNIKLTCVTMLCVLCAAGGCASYKSQKMEAGHNTAVLGKGYKFASLFQVEGQLAYVRDARNVCLSDVNGVKEKVLMHAINSCYKIQWSADGSELYGAILGNIWVIHNPALQGKGLSLCKRDDPEEPYLVFYTYLYMDYFMPVPGTDECYYLLTDFRIGHSGLSTLMKRSNNLKKPPTYPGKIVLHDMPGEAGIKRVIYALKASKIIIVLRDSSLKIYNLEGDLLCSHKPISEDQLVLHADNISPDCKHLYYEICEPDISYICVMNLETGGKRRLFEGSNPSISPDGKRLAFIRGGKSELWLVDLKVGSPSPVCVVRFTRDNGKEAKQRGEMYGKPCWSPDGRLLATRLEVESENSNSNPKKKVEGKVWTAIVDTQRKEIKLLDKDIICHSFRPLTER